MISETEEERTERLKAAWTKSFLESNGFPYVLDSILRKEISTADAVSFSEQGSMKDLAFLMTLLRVFLQAGFTS